MRRSILFSLPAIVLLSAITACTLQNFTISDPGLISTSAVQTVITELTQNIPSPTLPPFFSSLTPLPTFTAVPPTETPSETPTLTSTSTLTLTSTPAATTSNTATTTLTFTSTFTPSFPAVSVSVPTNCRGGPGITYNILGYLPVGEVVPVYGRDPAGLSWYIRNPDDSSSFCWIWGEYATFSGNLSGIPIYTPQPTPTLTPTPTLRVNSIVNYAGLDSCQNWWVEFTLNNIGTNIFKSVKISVLDTTNKTTVTKTTNGFINKSGCLVSTTTSALNPGKSVTVSSQLFAYNPTGHKLRATVTLCAKVDQNGACTTETYNFTP